MHFLMNGKSGMLLRFFVFLFLLASIGCQKEISMELPPSTGGGAGSGSAEFTLAPSGTSCSDAAVAGQFVAGTDLGLDAMLTVTVNVTKAGDWTYSTTIINGFAFAGAGNFTTTGKQAITLMAVGKPLKTGNSTFNLNIGGSLCSFIVTVTATNSGGGTVSLTDFYYKATIDGVNYSQDITATNDYEPGSGISGQDDVIFGGGITYAASSTLPLGKTDFGIEKGIMHGFLSATPAKFKAFFPVGNVPYAPTSFSTDGVVVHWTDPAGVAWTTRNGTVDQTNSTFKILSVQEFVDGGGYQFVKVKVEFSCKLYNGAGAVKQLTNGDAVIAFGMW